MRPSLMANSLHRSPLECPSRTHTPSTSPHLVRETWHQPTPGTSPHLAPAHTWHQPTPGARGHGEPPPAGVPARPLERHSPGLCLRQRCHRLRRCSPLPARGQSSRAGTRASTGAGTGAHPDTPTNGTSKDTYKQYIKRHLLRCRSTSRHTYKRYIKRHLQTVHKETPTNST